MRSLSKLVMSATVLAAAALSPSDARAGDAWRKMDTSSSCHTYLAWPYATSCTPAAGGFRIEKNCGVDCWRDTGGGGMAISVGSNYLWTITRTGQVRYMDPSTSEWTDMRMNACGTGAQVRIEQLDGRQHLAVGTDTSNRDVPWVVDTAGTLRFWRTKYSPKCWASAGQVPGDSAYAIGIYNEPNVHPDNTPWVVAGGNLYLKNGSGWDLLDTYTFNVSSLLNQIIDRDGVLWNYNNGTWSVDSSWPSSFGTPQCLTSGLWSPGFWVKKALITEAGEVWMFGQ
jgi:hypothetical protein